MKPSKHAPPAPAAAMQPASPHTQADTEAIIRQIQRRQTPAVHRSGRTGKYKVPAKPDAPGPAQKF